VEGERPTVSCPALDELLQDLIDCVQAAYDGQHADSVFGLQCQIVLEKARREAGHLMIGRCTPTRLSQTRRATQRAQCENSET
jgi:hypothetical protein